MYVKIKIHYNFINENKLIKDVEKNYVRNKQNYNYTRDDYEYVSLDFMSTDCQTRYRLLCNFLRHHGSNYDQICEQTYYKTEYPEIREIIDNLCDKFIEKYVPHLLIKC